MAYCVVTGSNGYSWKGSGGVEDLGTKVKENNGEKHRIRIIAVGPDNHYAVIFGNNGWSARGPQGFYDKMRAIDRSEVKQISFGPNDTWAIVMESGFCHASCLHGPDGPFDAINGINNDQQNIKYVGLTDNKEEWIVGFGNNGWKSRGMKDDMIEYMRGLNTGGATLASVTLGKDASHWIVATTAGAARWNFTSDSDFHSEAKGARLRVFH